MNTDTYNLLNICLEIEGLLCLVERRGETIPKNVSVTCFLQKPRLYETE